MIQQVKGLSGYQFRQFWRLAHDRKPLRLAGSSSPLPDPAIFRGVVVDEQASLELALISASRAAPVAA